jgi:hypothetical protein
MKTRDDFSQKTVLQIAKRAGWLCSFPPCRTPTVGATADGDGEINIGTAAHICAASPGGPRYDEKMTPAERSSAENGIWMCRDHGKAIDSDVNEFTVQRLHEWKNWRKRNHGGASCGMKHLHHSRRNPMTIYTCGFAMPQKPILRCFGTRRNGPPQLFRSDSKWTDSANRQRPTPLRVRSCHWMI